MSSGLGEAIRIIKDAQFQVSITSLCQNNVFWRYLEDGIPSFDFERSQNQWHTSASTKVAMHHSLQCDCLRYFRNAARPERLLAAAYIDQIRQKICLLGRLKR